MYSPRGTTPVRGYSRGLGAGETVIGYAAGTSGPTGTSMATLCQDTYFRLTHQALCAGGAAPSSSAPAPAPAPTSAAPTSAVPPAAQPQPLAPIIQTFDVGGGGGFAPAAEGAPQFSFDLTPGAVTMTSDAPAAGDVSVDVAGGKGFGLVEAAIAAALAFLIARSYK